VAQATFFPERVLYLYALFPLKMKHAALMLAAGELYLTVVAERSGIAHATHVCGAAGAWIYLRAMQWRTAPTGLRTVRPDNGPTKQPVRRKNQADIPWEL
jgi:hypothetical protein